MRTIRLASLPRGGEPWHWKCCYFPIGARVRFFTKKWIGFYDESCSARVTGWDRNQHGRISYAILFDRPLMRSMTYFGRRRRDVGYVTLTALLEDLVPDNVVVK